MKNFIKDLGRAINIFKAVPVKPSPRVDVKKELYPKGSLYEIFEKIKKGSANLIKSWGVNNYIKTEPMRYLRKRGANPRVKVKINEKGYIKTAWRNLPNLREFRINQEIGENIHLKLFGIASKAYEKELSTKPDQEPFIEIKKGLTNHVNGIPVRKAVKGWVEWTIYRKEEIGLEEYWEWCLNSLFHDKKLFAINLVNWKPSWYNELSEKGLKKIIMKYNDCQKKKMNEPLKESWIWDGKKWRNLAIANAGTRLFLSGLNKMIMTHLEEFLPPSEYHGFCANRGVGSYWKEILKKKSVKEGNKFKLRNKLESEIILEADFASCFNNIRKPKLFEVMRTELKFPEIVLKIIYHFVNLKVDLTNIKDIPSRDGLMESLLNKNFNYELRGLTQGLPISPTLANIAIYWGLTNVKKELKIDFDILAYADDISLYMKKKEFEKFRGDWKTILNDSESFRSMGLKLDKEKSDLVKNIEWENNLKLLGLKYDFKTGILESETRGRSENKIKGIKSTLPQNIKIDFKRIEDKNMLNELENLITKEEFLSDITSLTYETLLEHKDLKKYWNTIISYSFKGTVPIEQNFSLKNCTRGSIQWLIVNSKDKKIKKFLKRWKVTCHTISSYLIEGLIDLIYEKNNFNLLQQSFKRNTRIEKINVIGDWKSYEGVEIKFREGNDPLYIKEKYVEKEKLFKIENEYKKYFEELKKVNGD
jgi:Reverse transcriptase (RNA-dependent DNA polymerase)